MAYKVELEVKIVILISTKHLKNSYVRVVSVWVGRVMVVVGGHRIKAVKKRVYLKAAADNNIYMPKLLPIG